MLWIFATIVLFLVAAAGLVAARFKLKRTTRNRVSGEVGSETVDQPYKTTGRLVSAAAVGLWLLITVFCSIETVNAGEVGVVRQFGSIVGRVDEGVNFIAPWQSTDVVNVRTQRAEFEDLTAASSETQNVFLDVTINYAIEDAKVEALIREYGTNWFDVLVPARVLNFTKAETAKWETAEIVPNRDKIRALIQGRLVADLEDEGIIITDYLIRDISFNPEYLEAIEQKQVATENALKEQELVQVAVQQAQQGVEQAKGEAQEVEIEALAQANANNLITESLSPELLQWQAIQELADDIQIALIPSGEGIILDPATLLAGDETQTSEPAASQD